MWERRAREVGGRLYGKEGTGPQDFSQEWERGYDSDLPEEGEKK